MFNMTASMIKIENRRLLQHEFSGDSMEATLSPQPVSIKNTSISNSKKPFYPNTQLDSSMALTILILLTILFFISFFSVYINIRRFSNQETSDIRRRRNPSPPSRMVVKKKGLDSSTISALPLVSYRGGAKQGSIEDCTICLSEFEEGEMVKLIPNCKHVFHGFCIDTWLESHVSCPLCRCTQLFKNVDDVLLDVDLEGGKNCEIELGNRSTAEDGDTSAEVVGLSEIRR